MARLNRWLSVFACCLWLAGCSPQDDPRPNFLLVITDDQSWRHTSIAGDPAVRTPTFDRIARDGVYFSRAYASAPTCTASRSALFAGQHFWRTGGGAVLWGEYTDATPSYQLLLARAGYAVGYAGKGWGPGFYQGEQANPAGRPYQNADYVAAFETFLDRRRRGQPFSFVLSPPEPHRPFADAPREVAAAAVAVPAFLPDTPETRTDLARYLDAIQRQDRRLGAILALLGERGLLENTVVIVTSDNGMPFPRAKSNLYDYGVRVPLAIQWPRGIAPAARDEPVGLVDLAPTLLALAGVAAPPAMTGRSLAPLLQGAADETPGQAAFSGFERHIGDARAGGLTYPARAIHTARYVYIHNFAPERWPAGDPPQFADIDEQSPTKQVVLAGRHDAALAEFFRLATGKRPREELYDLQEDPFQLRNLAADERFADTKAKLKQRLFDELAATADPLLSEGDRAFVNRRYWAR